MLDLAICAIIFYPILTPVTNYFLITDIKAKALEFGMDVNANNFDAQLMQNPQMLEYLKSSNYLSLLLIPFMLNIMFFGIYCVFFWVKWGSTPGKFFTSTKIVDSNNFTNLNIYSAVKRYLGYFTFIFGIFGMLFTKRGTAVHDKLAGSVVIKR